ncbi:MAG: hypothetical protein DRI69_10045 [Bacteroidetes bacterium]|nr:MAG: hypothetical protein DRI69_10045 [Bacteroidota bacterium]
MRISEYKLARIIQAEFKKPKPNGHKVLIQLNKVLGVTSQDHADQWYSKLHSVKVDKIMADRDVEAAVVIFRKYLQAYSK